MNYGRLVLFTGIALFGLASAACTRSGEDAEGSRSMARAGEEEAAHAGEGESGHSDEHEPEARGPRGGRLVGEHDFALELKIYESGVPPELRVYPSAEGKPIDAAEVSLAIDLQRLGGRVDVLKLRAEGDYLVGDRTVEEPHSFDVKVAGLWREKKIEETYASYEGRVEIAPEAAERAGIVVEVVGPATIRTALRLSGRVGVNEDRLAHVVARFPGVVKDVRKRLGDRVAKGETLVVVESNESLRRYDVVSDIAGTVIARHATVGELTGEEHPLFVVADLSSVWVDLSVYRRDFASLAVGQEVSIEAGSDGPKARGVVQSISPLEDEATQATMARLVLPNPTGAWRPGLFVTADVIVEDAAVPVAVRPSALQTLHDEDVVFTNEGDAFEAQPVATGRRDAEWVEIVAGLEAGRKYVTAQSFVLKADIGKAGASHDH